MKKPDLHLHLPKFPVDWLIIGGMAAFPVLLVYATIRVLLKIKFDI